MLRLALAAMLVIGLGCLGGRDGKSVSSEDPEDTSAPREFEGDDGGECGDAADNDRDGLFDCDDPDCDGSPACPEDSPEDTGPDSTEFLVQVDARMSFGSSVEECVGESAVTVDWVSGRADGELRCTTAESEVTVRGAFAGQCGQGLLQGTWTAQALQQTLDISVSGGCSRTELSGTFYYTVVVLFEGDILGRPQ